MKKLTYWLLLAAFIGLILCPLLLAGNCTYRTYGYSSSSYGYGHASYNYNGYSTYTGYSYKQPGTSYFAGGYWPGGAGYSSGYYAPGYYAHYGPNYNYSSCSYHAPTYTPVIPYFPKYEAAILLARFPTYGVAAPPDVPARTDGYSGGGYGAGGTMGYNAAGGGYNAPPTPGYNTNNSIDGKLDKILVAVTTVSNDVAELKAWRTTIDQKLGNPPKNVTPASGTPALPVPPSGPDKATSPTTDDPLVLGPNILHTRCASCHDEKNVVTAKSKITLFVTGDNGPEMATKNDKGQIVPLTLKTLQKCKEEIHNTKTMPPKKDHTGKPVTPLSDSEAQIATAFLDKVTSQPSGPAVRE